MQLHLEASKRQQWKWFHLNRDYLFLWLTLKKDNSFFQNAHKYLYAFYCFIRRACPCKIPTISKNVIHSLTSTRILEIMIVKGLKVTWLTYRLGSFPSTVFSSPYSIRGRGESWEVNHSVYQILHFCYEALIILPLSSHCDHPSGHIVTWLSDTWIEQVA